MYRRLDDFVHGFTAQREATEKIFEALTDESLDQRVTDGHRSLGELAWHIVVSIPEMMQRTGLPLSAVDPESMPPAGAEAIRGAYAAVTGELEDAISEQWDDDTLEELDDMYGQQWPRGLTLSILLNHEIHHRAQMTVLMRQAGLQVPGVFGPSKEEWGEFGMNAPAY
ncbi:MAG: DinB family protein [Candidatus Krumholzibacteriia bacterium]|nr:DinB family protein [bacterium]MCB9513689.1 DinB family protein [Candidatus Latescibacterota bacterium]MCB9515468.1 DinB family protein [Candidatus Latescibacterota bacterium]